MIQDTKGKLINIQGNNLYIEYLNNFENRPTLFYMTHWGARYFGGISPKN